MTRGGSCWLDWHRRGLRRVCGSPVGRWSLWAASQASRPCGIHGEDGWEASAGSRRRRTPASQPRAATLPSSDGSAKGLHSSVRAEVLVSCRQYRRAREGGGQNSQNNFHSPGFVRKIFPDPPKVCGIGITPRANPATVMPPGGCRWLRSSPGCRSWSTRGRCALHEASRDRAARRHAIPPREGRGQSSASCPCWRSCDPGGGARCWQGERRW